MIAEQAVNSVAEVDIYKEVGNDMVLRIIAENDTLHVATLGALRGFAERRKVAVLCRSGASICFLSSVRSELLPASGCVIPGYNLFLSEKESLEGAVNLGRIRSYSFLRDPELAGRIRCLAAKFV